MKNISKSIKHIALGLAIVSLTACDLDINTDPNNPSAAPSGQLLATAEVRIANSLGSGSIGLSTGANVWMHQNTQRSGYDQYAVTGTAYSIVNAWDEMYTAMKDLNTIIERTDAPSTRYAGIAKILKAYAFTEMVDAWGDLPFTEANKGANNTTPKFDDDAAIYAACIALIDAGIADLAKTDAGVFIANNDLFYGGNLVRWRKFAKTLKLKLYTNVRLVQDVKASVQALVTEGDLLAAGEDFEMAYVNSITPENRNPGYLNDYPVGRNNYISPYFFEIMSGQNTFKHGNDLLTGIVDPRIPYYFYNQRRKDQNPENPSEYVNNVGSGGKFVSIFFASKGRNQGFDQAGSQTMPGLYFAGGKYDDNTATRAATTSGKGAVSLRLLPYFNRMYLQAELANVGLIGTPADAEGYLRTAIEASFAKVNAIATADGSPTIPTATITDYVSKVMALYTAGDAAKRLEIIMTQKWIANYGFAMDTFTDYRRTGLPKLYNPRTDDPSVYAPAGTTGEATNFTIQERDNAIVFPWKLEDLTLNRNAPKATDKINSTYKVFWMR
ncbi:MAG: SusD/RagB family nutrient-binding outer membrane lipoprotein [Leadbetterella sp.]